MPFAHEAGCLDQWHAALGHGDDPVADVGGIHLFAHGVLLGVTGGDGARPAFGLKGPQAGLST
ncbi:hypothetical protein D9M68_888970 [compost metagenome]